MAQAAGLAVRARPPCSVAFSDSVSQSRARAGFGAGNAFGQAAAPAAGSGTRAVPYQKTQDTDSQTSAGGQKQIVYFSSITAMPAYQAKSVEELRAEDYAVRPGRGYRVGLG